MPSRYRVRRRLTGASGAPTSLLNGELAVSEVDETIHYGKGLSGQLDADGQPLASSVIQIAAKPQHGHAISDVIGLQAALNSKADTTASDLYLSSLFV